MKFVKSITLLITLLISNLAFAYEETNATLKSQYLEETREAIIKLPDGYHKNKENSDPVLFC